MKVVYVTSESYIDHSYTIIKELKKHIDLDVFVQGKKETEEIKSWCSNFNAYFIKRKRFRNPLSILSEISFILKINKLKPELVWFNALTIYQLFLVKLLLKKFIVAVHDVEKHPGGKGHGELSVKLTLQFAKRNICVVSKTQAVLFKQYYGFEPPIFQLPVIDYYKEISASNAEKKQSIGINFFFFGSIEPYKGIETLIDAAEILQSRDIPFSLNIYGKIKYDVSNLYAKIKALNNVTLHDKFVDYKHVHEIYLQNDVLILPYKQVTQCGPLLIAFNELVPSICSNLDGFKEYIEDFKSGIIFNNSAEDLADKMIFFMNNIELRSQIKMALENEIQEKFSMLRLSDDYIKNFRNAL